MRWKYLKFQKNSDRRKIYYKYYQRLDNQCEEIGKLANHMISFPEKYISNKSIT